MDAAAELGRNPVSKHRVQLEYGDEQADAGRDCRTRLARPNSRGERTNADREIFIFPVQLTTCRIANLTWLIHTLAICGLYTHTNICICSMARPILSGMTRSPYRCKVTQRVECPIRGHWPQAKLRASRTARHNRKTAPSPQYSPQPATIIR